MSGIYIHIPFCKTHCTYCAFYSELLRNKQGSESFVSALLSEIADSDFPDNVRTLYIGGGTPSVLSISEFKAITAALETKFPIRGLKEFTVEVNPDDILHWGQDYVEALKSLGVSRISMGVQSFDDSVLHLMGRRHNAEQAKSAYKLLLNSHIDNLSIDLIFGFREGLDSAALEAELQDLGRLPQHISCYQLSIEEGSGLDRMQAKGLYSMPSDEECERQYYAICSLLKKLGYHHYEISNWALPGFESRHNSAYWNHSPYLGLGPGAHSLIIDEKGNFIRRWNDECLEKYLQVGAMAAGSERQRAWNTLRGEEKLTPEQIREERIFLGLRTDKGVDGQRIPEDKWFVSDSIIVDML